MKSRAHLLMAGILVWACTAHAGVVQTATERLEGKVTIEVEGVTIEGKKVPWDGVVRLLNDTKEPIAPRPQQVHLQNGEVWPCEIRRLAEKRLSIRSSLFGEMQVNVSRLAAIDFAPVPKGQTPGQNWKAKTLYRAKCDPIPGTLLRLDGDQLGIDSPLGEINLPRDGLVRYCWTGVPATFEDDVDEVGLTDGTILRGRLEVSDNALRLDHPVLGPVKLATKRVHSVVRHRPELWDLTELAPKSVRTSPLTGGDAPAPMCCTVRGDGSELFVKGLRIEPKTVVCFALPKTSEKMVKLRALLVPINGGSGDVRVRIRSGKEERLHQEVKAGDEPKAVTVEIPADDESVEIEVDFGKVLRFPSGVVIGDPWFSLTTTSRD
jgi:hypothetical protein